MLLLFRLPSCGVWYLWICFPSVSCAFLSMMTATEETMRTRPGRTNKPSFSAFISQRPWGTFVSEGRHQKCECKMKTLPDRWATAAGLQRLSLNIWTCMYVSWFWLMFTFLYIIVFQSFVLLSVVVNLVAPRRDVAGVFHYLLSQSHPGLILRNFYQQRQKKIITCQNLIQKCSIQHLNNRILAVCYLKSINPQRAIQPVSTSFLLQWIINVSEKSHTVFTVTWNVS